MKIALRLLIAAMPFCVATADEPHFTREQVTKIGRLILAQENSGFFIDAFKLDSPKFDQKTRLWSFPQTKTPSSAPDAGSANFLEIRDADGFYRLGKISYTGVWPINSYKFRMSPALRAKMRVILK